MTLILASASPRRSELLRNAGIAFTVETHNPKGPVVEWTGSVEGGVASGKARRTIDGKVAVGTFSGSTKQVASESSCTKVRRICPAIL